MNPSLIVCPVAFSSGGRSALAQAAALARWHDADLHVLHVRGSRRLSPPAVASSFDANDGLERRLAAFMGALMDGVRISAVELAGNAVTAVGDYARQKGADLLVVAKHGRPNGTFWRAGAYARDLARDTTCPTLVIPDTHETERRDTTVFTNILCPTDLSAGSAVAVEGALALAQRSAGRLTLLHVLEGFPYETPYSGSQASRLIGDYQARVERTSRELRRRVPLDAFNWCQIETKVVSGVPHRSILAAAAELRADLVVMGLPDRSMVERVVMGSTTAPVLRRADCPVLVIPSGGNELTGLSEINTYSIAQNATI